MSVKIHVILATAFLLSSCTTRREFHNAVVLERRSPAVGNNGLLVEAVGLETVGGVFTPLLKSGCAIPCKVSEIFSTAQDNQSTIQVNLFRGSGRLVSDNHLLGICHVVNIQAQPRGMPQIVVTVEAAEQDLRLSAVNQETNVPLAIECEGKSNP